MRRPGENELMIALEKHELWIRSGFQEGQRANFASCDLSGCDLSHRNLSGANFSKASLQGANLTNTIFFGARLREANLSGAVMYDTVLRRVDLRKVNGLDCVIHRGPSTIGVDTILRSGGDIPGSFLIGVGVPAASVTALRRWGAQYSGSESFYSAFISYGGPDEEMALRLRDALLDRGVETFLFVIDAKPGKRIYEVMQEAIREHDRILLLCSRTSLGRSGVRYELVQAFELEARQGGLSLVIPARIDMTLPLSEIAAIVGDRVVCDCFGGDVEFQEGVAKLMSALTKPENE